MKPFFLRLHFFIISFFFFFFFFSLTLSVSSLSASPHPDLLALLSLKSSLRGHAALADWKATAASFSGEWPAWCGWSGVKCDPGTGNIVSLDVSSRNLSGQVPAEIRYLSHLTELNLSRNSLGGAIPGEIFELASLRTLDISRNNFNSTFPAGISNLRFLTFFDAYNNNLTGTLPEEISRLRFLEWLNLGGSGFHGGAVTSYGGLKNLKFLKLAGCGLNGSIPPELGLLTRLEQLEIGYNSFEGGVPPELSLAKNLTYLDISSGGLSGPIAPELGNLTNLQTLLLFNNRFSGEIPRSFGNLRAMRNIDLSGNLLTGPIPEEFSSMKELVGLNLMLNQLSGKVPEGIADLPNLQYFYLWNNSLTGSLPQNLGLNAKLIKFDVSSNSLSGPIPPSLCSGDALDKIILFGNQFSGGIPPSLANCAALARIRIQKNRLNGSIPYGFGRLRNLTFMDISGNDLSGAIPVDLATGERLQFLNISGNAFGTELPENIWSAPSLQIFSASACNLIGRIPKFSGCRSLYKIELAGNSLNGSIPGDVDSCEKLISLNLHRNSLAGGIPWELSALPSIADVDLSHNSLTGAIPPNFSNCNTVENFNVSFNRLTGPIPATCTIFSNLHPSSFAGNEALCGGNLLKPCDSVAAPAVPKEKKPRKTAGKILWIMAAAFGVGLFVLVAGSQWLRSHGFSLGGSAGIRHAKSAAGPWKLTAFQRLNFTAEDVADCTSAAEGIIGMGTQGTVYRAEMPGGEIIAVKKLWGQNKESTIRKRKGGVLAEVDVLGHVRHRNVVRMIGYCGNSECTMLLYEYMPNGSLDDLLHGKSKGQRNLVADWVTRYKIALGVAQGICYLHHDCDPVIVHRDLKPSNILLDGEMEARVADFGVAKLIQSDEVMSVVAGSYGYIAPEYTYTLQVDEKSDIYSYGVVLMEILTGKRCSDAAFGEGNSIVDWIRSKIKTKEGLSDVLDKNAGASCDSVREEMILVLRVALLCTSRNPADRPSMRDVVSMLHEAKPQRKLPESMDFVGTVNPVIGVNGGGDGGDGSSPFVHRASILDC